MIFPSWVEKQNEEAQSVRNIAQKFKKSCSKANVGMMELPKLATVNRDLQAAPANPVSFKVRPLQLIYVNFT